MSLLEPDPREPEPPSEAVAKMCGDLGLRPINSSAAAFASLISGLRETHVNGGAFLAGFEIDENRTFDFYASHNCLANLWEDGPSKRKIIDLLLFHPVIRDALPEMRIPERPGSSAKFEREDPFQVDGIFAALLYEGGAYSGRSHGNGRSEKELALAVCDEMFELRYGEASVYSSDYPWTDWFHSESWDKSVVVIDKRRRLLWLLCVTDTD